MEVTLCDTQLNTQVIVKTIENGVETYIKMKIDRWQEFKLSIKTIDEEFYKRFNSQQQFRS